MTKKKLRGQITELRNRIKGHRRVRAGDLVPNDLNFRRHPKQQEAALLGLYEEIGFARSLLAYELPDGRLKLIDGHLRRELTPDAEVEVEVVDLTEDEAKLLLASLDPLAAVAETDGEKLEELLRQVQTSDEDVARLLDDLAKEAGIVPAEEEEKGTEEPLTPIYQILIECKSEEEQAALLERLLGEGIQCRSLIV